MIVDGESQTCIYKYFEKIEKISEETKRLDSSYTTESSINYEITQILKEVEREYHATTLKPKYIIFKNINLSLNPNCVVELKIAFYDDSFDAKEHEEMIKYLQTILFFFYNEKRVAINRTPDPFHLKIYIFMTDLKKEFEFFSEKVIGKKNVNSGYSWIQTSFNKRIVIYRKEEWSKVLIHELIHSFELDFSSDSILSKFAKDNVKRIFLNIKSEINLFEAFTETIAEIIYLIFIVKKEMETKNESGRIGFLKRFEKKFERLQIYSVNQCIDILKHNHGCQNGRDECDEKRLFEKIYDGTLKYREGSNVLSYYIIKSIFLYYINDFLKCLYSKRTESVFFTNTNVRNKEKIICLISFLKKDKLFSLQEKSFISFAKEKVVKKTHGRNFTSSLKMTPFNYFSKGGRRLLNKTKRRRRRGCGRRRTTRHRGE